MKNITLVVLMATMIAYAQTQTPLCSSGCVCDTETPCQECFNTAVQRKNEAGTRCFICPGSLCNECSSNYVCSAFADCPDPAT